VAFYAVFFGQFAPPPIIESKQFERYSPIRQRSADSEAGLNQMRPKHQFLIAVMP
jgi:hypothetical protein